MKKLILILTVILSQMSFAQVSFDKNKLVKDGQKYKLSKYSQVFTNQQAIDYIKKGRTNKTVADVFAITGGFGIGFSLALIVSSPKNKTYNLGYGYGSITQKTDNSVRWLVFGASTGLALISIPFYSGANKNIKKAIAIENGESDVAFKPYFDLKSAGNGIAMSYNF